jgi:5-oxoprolinase (ATP-hydrolysing) subunit C
MIEVLSAGALTTVQDRGRYGCLRWGVGTAGAMDGVALAVGNILLGNDEGCAAIEVQVFPFRVRFHAETAFSLTGADCAAKLDGVPLLPAHGPGRSCSSPRPSRVRNAPAARTSACRAASTCRWC